MNKIKNIVLGLSLISVSAVQAQTHSFDGFTAGIQGGYLELSNKSELDCFNGVKGSNSASRSGGIGGFNLGYGKTLYNKFYAGVEATAMFTNLNLENNSRVFTNNTTVKTGLVLKESYGAALRLGYTMGQCLPYVKVGYVNSKFNAKLQSDDLGYAKADKHLDGLDLGVGVDMKLTDRVLAGFEFSHQEYKKIHYKIFDSTGPVNFESSVKPKVNLFLAKLKIKI